MVEAPERLIRVGVIAKAHGVRGELSVKTDVPGSRTLMMQTRLYLRDAQGRLESRQIRTARAAEKQMLLELEGVDDRDAAQALHGREVMLPRACLPPVEQGEYYAADLIGMAVKSPTGAPLGRVTRLNDAGGVPVLMIEGERELQVPLVDVFVKQVNVEAGEMIVEPPLEEETEEAPKKKGRRG
jgi:16S rRNA processing protein RimM